MIVPDARVSADDVRRHYDELDLAYRRIWGEHVHHGYWRSGRESAAEAAAALTTLVGERLALAPGQALVDIGCGYGATAAQFARTAGAAVTGFTVSEAQAAVARARPEPGLAFEVADWLENRLADAAFDGAYAIESSEHMADKPRFFTEAARVLKPGGRLVVCAWLEGERVRPWEVRRLLEPICREGRMPGLGSRRDYEAMAAAVGLRLLSHEDISRNVRRTWSICARRLLGRLVTDADIRRLAFGRATRSRDFMFSLPRLILALRTGAMRYGVFVWEKPLSDGAAASA
jgi:tocopherol O-methyltransferase